MWFNARTGMLGLFDCAIALAVIASAGSEKRRSLRLAAPGLSD